MNIKFTISMTVAILGLVVGFYLLNDIQQEKQSEITQNSLDVALQESNSRLSVVREQFYNGKYNGELSKDEAIKIIKDEVQIQKEILEQYRTMPNHMKTDETIDTRLSHIGKDQWAEEDSMLEALENSP